MRTLFLSLLILCLTLPAVAQSPTPITADNIDALQSVRQIDFAESDDTFDTGWFAINADASRIATVTQDQTIILWDDAGDLIGAYPFEPQSDSPVRLADIAFSDESDIFAAVYIHTPGYHLSYYNEADGLLASVTIEAEFDQPTALWLDDNDIAWAEIAALEIADSYVIQFPASDAIDADAALNPADLVTLPYAPYDDPEALVRIGRILAPGAVTASPEGAVKLWDLQTGDMLAETNVDAGPAVFGQINAGGDALVWRDPMSAALHVLDFASGENQTVTELEGAYVQFFSLNPAADTVIAVHQAAEPTVGAWAVASGVRYDLGTYRECSRVADLVRLSKDGTTLVIGCDLGLELWRVAE